MLRALIATVLLVGHSVAVPTRIAQADDLQKVVTQNRFKMLFMDAENIASKSGDVQLVANKANKQGRVIEPTEPWETWAVFGYNTVIHWGPGDIRMYYDCIASKEGHFGSRFTCLATSADGVTWTKPVLNLATFNGSTENNIVWPLAEGQTWEPGTVFVDTNPAVPDSERVKMIGTWHSTGGSGMYVFASSDGLAFKPLYDKPSLVGSDTKNVAWYDATLGKYVGYMRLDTATPLEHNVTCPAGGLVRRIGRCTFDSLEVSSAASVPQLRQAWGCDPKNATDIFTFDQSDPPCVDVYTSSATEYEGSILFFPAMYSHMTLATKFGNDGMLDIRFAFAQNTSAPAIYPNAQNARSPFVRLGVDRCRELEPAVYPSRMLFCRDDQTKQFTDFDSVAMYMASGYVLSADGGELMLYYSGQSFTHGDDAGSDVWGTNSGIGLATIRLDGFVSVDAGYDFATPPTVTTAPIPIPSDCPSVTSCGGLSTGCPVFSANVSCTSNSQCAGYTCDGGHTATCNQGVCTTNQSLVCQAGGPILRVNIETSVAGYALAQLHTGDRVVEGADLASSDPIRGNFLSLPLSWNGAAILGGLQGQKVQLMLEMVDAKLYSVEATCHS